MKTVIQIRRLTKHYHMGDTVVQALDGVDLDIAEGEYVAITGASGSGKSTMMHLLGCLDRPTSGTYELDGDLVSSMSDAQLAVIRNRKIGFVFQTFNLIQRTSAVENVAVPLFYGRQTRVQEPSLLALRRVGLEQRAWHKPNELSGGERQRVAIARAIVNNPRLLLADEPTGNLDSKNGRAIMEVFNELNRAGVTIALVTHEMAVAAQARRIIRMVDGKIIEDAVVTDAVRRELLGGGHYHGDAATSSHPPAIDSAAPTSATPPVAAKSIPMARKATAPPPAENGEDGSGGEHPTSGSRHRGFVETPKP